MKRESVCAYVYTCMVNVRQTKKRVSSHGR